MFRNMNYSSSPSGDNPHPWVWISGLEPIPSLTLFRGLKKQLERTCFNHDPHDVVFWFRNKDLRLQDNTGLHRASERRSQGNGRLIAMYLDSPNSLESQHMGRAQANFLHEGLLLLEEELAEKSIPLVVLRAETKEQEVETVLEFIKNSHVSNVFANYDYEMDKMQRDFDIAWGLQQLGRGFDMFHDHTCLVPGDVSIACRGSLGLDFDGFCELWVKNMRTWLSMSELLPEPEANDLNMATARPGNRSDSAIPPLPDSKRFSTPEKQRRIHELWPAGRREAMACLSNFVRREVRLYAAHCSEPARDPAFRLWLYLAFGMISVREAAEMALSAIPSTSHDTNDEGIRAWVRELAFRDFCRHEAFRSSYSSHSPPSNQKFDAVQWETDREGGRRWADGLTGVPLVDAAMRQLKHQAYMPHILRRIVLSYLRVNLLIDYRRGMNFFAKRLIDWNLVDQVRDWEPNGELLDPVKHADMCDPEGEYIRRWVPELARLKGNQTSDPYHRVSAAKFDQLHYPKPYVNLRQSTARAIQKFALEVIEVNDDEE